MYPTYRVVNYLKQLRKKHINDLGGIAFLFILGSIFKKLHRLHFELSERVEKAHFICLITVKNKPTFSLQVSDIIVLKSPWLKTILPDYG